MFVWKRNRDCTFVLRCVHVYPHIMCGSRIRGTHTRTCNVGGGEHPTHTHTHTHTNVYTHGDIRDEHKYPTCTSTYAHIRTTNHAEFLLQSSIDHPPAYKHGCFRSDTL